MSTRLSDSGTPPPPSAAPFSTASSNTTLPPARPPPSIFQRLQLGKPKSRRALRSASSSSASRSIGEEEAAAEEEQKKSTLGSTAGSSTTDAWAGIGSSGTGTTTTTSMQTTLATATTTLASSLSMSSSHRGSIGAPSPRSVTGPNGVALPGHLKMKTGGPTPLPPPLAAPAPPAQDVQPGDPSPSRPRPSHQPLAGGTVSRLTAHLSPSRSNSRDGEGGGGGGGGEEGESGILNIDLTSDNEAEEDRQQQQTQQQKQQQQRKGGRAPRRLEEEEEASSSDDESGGSSQKHKPIASSPSKSNSTTTSSSSGRSRRRGIGELAQAAITKLGGKSANASVAAAAAAAATAKSYTERKFEELMAAEVVDLGKLRELSWGGIPDRHRGTIWRLLLGYLPANRDRREATQTRKRREYAEILPLYFNIAPEERTMQEQEILRQILVDLPRTQPDMPLFHQEEIQRCMERILYVWAIRHPASGYVQGMNDLVVPLILVFLAERLMHPSSSGGSGGGDITTDEVSSSSFSSSARAGRSVSGAAAAEAQALDVSKVPHEVLEQVEADVYWCMTKLLDNIQDHYTFSQPGLQRMIFRLQALIERHDPILHRHLDEEGLQYVQFAFRWMNCLLIRELSLDAIIRIWDTELAEEAGGFEAFHVYLCAAFLLRFSEHLRTLPFQDLVLFLQDVPTHDWTLHEIEPLLSQAHVLRSLYPEFGQPGGARTIPGRGGGK